MNLIKILQIIFTYIRRSMTKFRLVYQSSAKLQGF